MPSEFLEGNNRITVDIHDIDRSPVGPGPLMTCLDLTCDSLLSQPGSFTARFPANDPRLAYLQLKRHRLTFYLDSTPIFYGIAENWSHEIDNSGQRILVVSGRDQLAELDDISITVFDAAAEDAPRYDIPQELVLQETISLPGTGWSWFATSTETAVYGNFAGESVLSALTRIAERIGEGFRLDGYRDIRWIGTTPPSSGARAVQGAGDAIAAETNPHICFIQRLTERRNTTRFITGVKPRGSGWGETQLDLEGTTRSAPSGFTLDEAANTITSDAALAYMGTPLVRRVDFKEIRPLFNIDADVEYAKDYLFDAALAYLQRNDSIADFIEYDLEVAQLPYTANPATLQPAGVEIGSSIHVVYQDANLDIDAELVVLGVRISVDSTGAPQYTLTVAATNQWHLQENNGTLSQVEQGEILLGHPQIDANSYWENFREEVGDDMLDHIAEFPFVLGDEIVTIRQVLFRYKVDRILTGTNSYAYSDPATSPNTAALATDGGVAATTDPNSAALTTDGGVAATTDPNSAALVTDGGVAATTDPNSAALVTDGGVAATTDPNGAALTTDPGVAATTDPNGTALATDSGVAETTDSNAAALATDSGVAETTDANGVFGDPHTHNHSTGHFHTIPSHTHNHSTGHFHTIPSHTHNSSATHFHTIPTHTHNSSTTHFHTIPAHTHNSSVTHFHTIASHTHNSSVTHFHTVPSHTHNSSTTHFHTITSHTHPMADLVATFAVTRVPALNSYVLADLEYSVNGGTWASLDSGTPVAGGYYQLDITSEIQAAGGLRRPLQSDNLVQVRRKTAAGTGKTALVRAKLGIRSTIQSIVLYS